jgi:membrane protein DedA with SNARE-associated domain
VENLVVDVVARLGIWGVALLMFAENIFPPIPSELIMPLAGYLSLSGDMSFPLLVLAGSFGSLSGAAVWYGIGRLLAPEKLAGWIDRHGAWLAISNSDIRRSTGWFERHGNASVLFGRLVPVVRTLISVPAGMTRMPVSRFALFSAIGTLIWTTGLAFAGRILRQRFEQVELYVGPVSWLIIGLVVLLYLIRLIQTRRQLRHPEQP